MDLWINIPTRTDLYFDKYTDFALNLTVKIEIIDSTSTAFTQTIMPWQLSVMLVKLTQWLQK